MANVIPFRAVRPTRDKVSLIACRSYDSYSDAQVESRLRDNPFSFLHIINPGYKFHKTLVGEERYALVKNRYQEFKEDLFFIQEEKPTYYVYKIVDRDGVSYKGIVAAACADDYRNDVIKKHEETLENKERIFVKYLKTVGFNAEPVLLTYPDHDELDAIIAKSMQIRPEYEFTTTYRDTHSMWIVEDTALVSKISKIFSEMKMLYIADGHHRSSSSVLLSEELKKENGNHQGDEAYNFFMSYLIPESHLKIYEFNRLVKDLNGLSKEEFLIRLDAMYRIENRGAELYKPTSKHHFSMYLDGEFYSLYLRKNNWQITNALDALDTQILYQTILKPILGIEDLRNGDRIEYSHGKNDLVHVKSVIDSGEFTVGFGLVPININELKKIANEGLQMPPKSTYIEPKLRSGVTIYEF